MSLSRIKAYLQARQQASLEDIALHLNSPTEAVRGMLDIWVRKGRIECCQVSEACGSTCQKCDSTSLEIYRWNNDAVSSKLIPVRRLQQGL